MDLKETKGNKDVKKYRNLILLIVFILLLGLFFFLRKQEPKENLLKIIPVDSLAIAKIQIFDAADTVIVYKKDGLWLMSHPDQAAVNPDMLKFFFERVLTATYANTAMNENAKNLHQYGLNKEKEVQLKLFDQKDKLLSHCRFGNTNNPYDYFRYGNSSKIYQVKTQVISGHLKPDVSSWRSPVILSIPPFKMTEIHVSHPKNSYELTRKKTDWFYKDKTEQFMVPYGNITMGKILNSLEELQAYTYKKPAEIDKQSLIVAAEVQIILTDKTKHKLVFYQQGDNYYLILDDNEERYYNMVFDQVFRFTRQAALFNVQEWPS